jgi:cyclic beta-1,2-glucan synthetase
VQNSQHNTNTLETESHSSVFEGVGRLENLARQLAERQTATRHPIRRNPVASRLKELDVLLHEAYHYFAKVSEEDPTLSQAAEWLLDNFYIGQQALRQIREDMPAGFYRQLPKLDSSPYKGFPRIYYLAREVIRYSENRLEVGVVTRFVHAHQRIKSLTMGELWALPTMLRLGALENLVEALTRITGLPSADGSETTLELTLPMTLTDEEIVAGSIVSLRTLGAQDWTAFFESVSHVEGILRGDPADIYAHMDFDTRDRYRKVIEELARKTSFDEEGVAKEVINLAKNAPEQRETTRVNHVGFYLLDEGLVQLEARINFQPSWRLRSRRWVFAHPSLTYFGAVGLLFLAILYGFIRYVHMAGGTTLHLIVTSLLVITPGLTVVVDFVNWLITNTVQPRVLPKMEFKSGIPAQYRTVIAIPALLSHPSDIESVLQQMELHYLGNADPQIRFILLTDFVDAPQLEMPGDQALLELTKAGIHTLNKRYARETDDLFYLFHRQRRWNSSENCWMGWERKRGKLVELNRLILGGTTEPGMTPAEKNVGGTSSNLLIGDLDFLSKTKYVITLDDDTFLPPDGARRLISTLAHPLNRAEFDPDTGKLISGYTVLQPRVEIRPASANQSRFTRIFSGDTALDLYSRAVSDIYQDFFGEGIFAGKGIYDVTAFEHSLSGRVPDNALLSHDLFEGIHGRAGLVTDVILLEDYPPNYHIYTQRLHRWIRGDWQLLPWLSFNVPTERGEREPNDLSMLDRWKFFDNLRRSLIMPSLLALIIAGWLWLPGSAIIWMMVVLITPAVPFATNLVSGLVRGLGNLSFDGFRQSTRSVALRWLLAVIFIPHEALLVLDAVAATLVRLSITRRHLLRWTSAAHSIRIFGRETRLALMWRRMIGAPLLSLTLALLVWLLKPVALPTVVPLLLTWSISPMIAHWIS